MATHSSNLAWRIPWTEESMRSQRVGHARTLEWVAISFSNAWKWKVKGKSLSRVRLLATPWTPAYQAPPSMGFSGQQYRSGVPLPSPHISSNIPLMTIYVFSKISLSLTMLSTFFWIFTSRYLKVHSSIDSAYMPQNSTVYYVPHNFSRICSLSNFKAYFTFLGIYYSSTTFLYKSAFVFYSCCTINVLA